MATQSRVSNWVQDQTSRLQQPQPYSRSISVPPSDYSHHTSSRRPERSHSRHRSSSSSHNDRRPEPHRSVTTPDAVPRSMHSSHSRGPPQPVYYSNPAPVSYVTQTTAAPQSYNSGYRTYQYDGNSREIVIPRPRAGETYVIIPPAGRRVEVVVSVFLHLDILLNANHCCCTDGGLPELALLVQEQQPQSDHPDEEGPAAVQAAIRVRRPSVVEVAKQHTDPARAHPIILNSTTCLFLTLSRVIAPSPQAILPFYYCHYCRLDLVRCTSC